MPLSPRLAPSSDAPSPIKILTTLTQLTPQTTFGLVPPTTMVVPTIPTSPTAGDNTSDPLEVSSPDLPELLGRGERLCQPSVLLKYYVVNASELSTSFSLL